MDFFQHQEQARRRTVWLVFLYVFAILLLAAAVYGVVFFCLLQGGGDPLDPTILFSVTGGVLLLVLGGSFYKTLALSSGGGRKVAEMLGGRQISPSTYQPAERRLYNVVEEMSLAAGVPIPTIYIMDNEHGINAFAAGFSPQESVISVNRGTVDLLSRDELQGVIAHEFSHILNGDMRMNLRLIGILFGLQVLATVGYYVMRGSMRSRGKSGGKSILVLIGLGVMVIGYVGVLVGAMIKAAISRQREFLADASAVQFTRNPAGIAGALKKIGCPKVGSAVSNEHAAETSHLFFGNVCAAFSLGNLFATHPDLTLRIKRIDPTFDGQFPTRIEPVKFSAETDARKTTQSAPLHVQPINFTEETDTEKIGGNTNACSRLLPDVKNLTDNIGNVNSETIIIAAALLQSIPEDIADNAREPLTAKVTFYAILIQTDAEVQQKQIEILSVEETPFVVRQTLQVFRRLQGIANTAKIPLAQIITAALRQLTVEQYKLFCRVVDQLIAADQKLSLFEYTLKAILLRDLDVHFGFAKPLRVRYSTLEAVRLPVKVVLSFIAYSGHANVDEAKNAFDTAAKELGLTDSILCNSDCNFRTFGKSLHLIAETSPMLKKQIYEALLKCIRYDGKISVEEGELIRATAAILEIPMPVF
ncbi:MAG: M48 family metallopeptidase [Planctomycetaceae bacterium]|jgi:Zn-dependent protease with chaperone function|nr:M48 family metallopeptidase [Planctomycetaceae bacterium]